MVAAAAAGVKFDFFLSLLKGFGTNFSGVGEAAGVGGEVSSFFLALLKGLGANFFCGAGDCSREELGAELDLFDFLSLLGSRLKYFLTSASSLFSNLHSLGLTTSFSASCLNLSSSYIKNTSDYDHI